MDTKEQVKELKEEAKRAHDNGNLQESLELYRKARDLAFYHKSRELLHESRYCGEQIRALEDRIPPWDEKEKKRRSDEYDGFISGVRDGCVSWDY